MSGIKMKLLLIVCVAAFCALAETPDDKSDAIKIPLDQIWAYEMPGTRDIKTISKNVPADEVNMRILNAVWELWHERAVRLNLKDMARPGFAVSGRGRSALLAAFAVFIDSDARREEFPPDKELAIVFYSEPFGRYRVQIRHVERKENDIVIRYELMPDIAGGSHLCLALIPLGELPAGKYHVEMQQLPHDLTSVETKFGFEPLNDEWSRDFLCKPFRFKVEEKPRDQDNEAGAGNEQA